jgi:hypothetical protein
MLQAQTTIFLAEDCLGYREVALAEEEAQAGLGLPRLEMVVVRKMNLLSFW